MIFFCLSANSDIDSGPMAVSHLFGEKQISLSGRLAFHNCSVRQDIWTFENLFFSFFQLFQLCYYTHKGDTHLEPQTFQLQGGGSCCTKLMSLTHSSLTHSISQLKKDPNESKSEHFSTNLFCLFMLSLCDVIIVDNQMYLFDIKMPATVRANHDQKYL